MVHAIALAVMLEVSNVAGVPAGVLVRAQSEVTRLYRGIGVDVAFAPPRSIAAPDAIRVVLLPYQTGALRGRPKQAMGAAVRVSARTRVAYVFYGEIADEARRHGVSPALLLACTIAHEVGHLLLPAAGHSPTGLMRACWNGDDYGLASQGRLRFLPEQAARIRDAIAGIPTGF